MIHRSTSSPLCVAALMISMAIGLHAATQQPAPPPNNLGRAVVLQTPPIPGIRLLADRDSAFVGETVTFTLDPANPVNSRYVFTIAFGDTETLEISGDNFRFQHVYKEPGTFEVLFSYKLRPPAEDYGLKAATGSGAKIQINPIMLNSSPSNPAIDETVTFETAFPNNRPDIRYRFVFGDETDPSTAPLILEPQSRHAYSRAGTFDAQLEVGHLKGEDFTAFAKTVAQVVVAPAAAAPAPVPELTSFPSQPGEGEPVSFKIGYPEGDANLVFRIEFGDGSPPTEWSTSAVATHSYRPPGTYTAHGEVGRLVNGNVVPIANSADIFVVVLAPAIPVLPWILLIVAIATVLAIHQYRKNIVGPQPVLEVHRNSEKSTDEIDGLTVEVQIRLIRNEADGAFELQTDEQKLITSRRTIHG